MLSFKEIEYLENTLAKEISIRKRLIERLEFNSKEKEGISLAHTELAIKKQKDCLNVHLGIFDKLRNLGGF